MDQYLISPEDCLIVRAFTEAASLRDAARMLNCDPAGLLRKVQRISDDHGYLQKVNGRWCLTASGRALAAWTETSIRSQRRLIESEESLILASTTWFTEQALVPYLSALKEALPNKPRLVLTVPDKSLEVEIKEGSADFVIVCHPPEDPAVAHKQVGEEQWVVIAPKEFKASNVDELFDHPFVRHSGINPEMFFPGRDLSGALGDLTFDNLTGVRAAVVHGHGWSVVPRILVHDHLKTGMLAQVGKPLKLDRKVCVWWLRQRADSRKRAPAICSWVSDICESIQ